MLEFARVSRRRRSGLRKQSEKGRYDRSALYTAYPLYLDLLLRADKQRNAAAGLQVSERARARSLLESLAENRAEITAGADQRLFEREQSLRQRLDAKAATQTRLLNTKHTAAQAEATAEEVADLMSQYKELEERIRVSSPRYAALTQPQPLTAAEIHTLLLEYALGEQRSYLWLVSPQSLAVYELLTARQPKAGPTEARQRARITSAETEFQTQAAALSPMLLGPVAMQLGGKRLAVVASDALEYIPFAALPDPVTATANGCQPLNAAHEVINLPSASSLAVIRSETAGRRTAEKTVAALADPVFDASDLRVTLAR